MKDKETEISSACASCTTKTVERICLREDGSGSRGCPTLRHESVLEDTRKEYEAPDILEFSRQASIQEAECYANRMENPFVLEPTKTRILEICEFAQKMGYQRLGLAFCLGLAREASVVDKIFRSHGFDVISNPSLKGLI